MNLKNEETTIWFLQQQKLSKTTLYQGIFLTKKK
jgi:hypothetical protein